MYNAQVLFTAKSKYYGSKFVWFKDAANTSGQSVLNGNRILNPYKGQGMAFMGDLFEYNLGGEGYLLKSYLLKNAWTKVIGTEEGTLVFDAAKSHQIEVGDKLMLAPDDVATKSTFVTITAVTMNEMDMTFTCKISNADAKLLNNAAAGSIFCEAGKADTTVTTNAEVLVKNPNTWVVTNELFTVPTNGAYGFSNVEYSITTERGREAFIERMHPIPPYVLKLNKSNIKGLFGL